MIPSPSSGSDHVDPVFGERKQTVSPGESAGAERPDQRVRDAFASLQRAAVVYCRLRLQPDVCLEAISSDIERLTGYDADEFAGHRDLVRRVVHSDDRARLAAVLADPAQLPTHPGWRVVHRDGRVVQTSHAAFVTRDGEGHPAMIDLVVRDVSALWAEADAGATSDHEPNLTGVSYLADATGFTHLGPAIERLTGFSAKEWIDRPTLWAERLHPDDRARLLFLSTAGAAGQAWQAEYRWLAKDGGIVGIRHASAPVRDPSGDPIGQHGLLLPEMPSPASDARHVEAQRMDAMARLAGVVAHDLNNVLTVVLGHSEILADSLRATARARESALEIKNAAETAARVTSQLLALSGHQALAPRSIDMNEAIHQSVETLHQLAGGELELRLDLSPRLPPVEIDASQLERVLRNLVLDARDAGGGRLTISTRPAQQGTRREIVLMLADGRPRLTEEALSAMFEPALGSRRQPLGSGLNRAAVYGIVGQAGGRISVQQAPAGGLTFLLVFPASPA